MTSEIITYDPRLGQEFETTNFITKRHFSNLQYGFFVICGIGIEWETRADLLKEMILSTAKTGFVTVTPWYPHSATLMQQMKSAFPTTQDFEQSLISYFKLDGKFLELILRLRGMSGGPNSGEWCFGSCLEEFDPPLRISLTKAELWDFSHILGQPEKIGCALDLAEMSQSTLVTRIFGGFDEWLGRLRLAEQ